MRKKQLLATLVMLSLMQGSVYAAETINQNDFKNNVYTAKEESIGSVEITTSKGDYILNTEQEGSTIAIDPTRSDDAAIVIDSKNATTDLSSLTINAGVQIAGTTEAPLKTTDALIQVGDSKGGKLTIDGDLSIDNALSEAKSSNSIISVSSGAVDTKTGNTIASSFSGKDITISNSQAVSSSSAASGSSLIRITGYKNTIYGNKNAIFTAADVDLINSTAYHAIYMDTTDTTLNNVSFKGGSYNYGLDTGDESTRNATQVNFTANSIKAEGTAFTNGFIRMFNDKSFNVEGDISYDGAGTDPSVAGDNHFINFTNTDVVTVGGNVTVKNLSWNDNVLYVSNADTATFGNITIDNITQNESSDSNGVRVNKVDAFEAGAIKVTNMNFLQGNDNQYGVSFIDSNVKALTSVKVDGLAYENVDVLTGRPDDHGGAGTGSAGNGGLKVSGSTFENTLDSIAVKNIERKSGDDKDTQHYHGVTLESDLNAEVFTIDGVKTNNAFDNATGFDSTKSTGYQTFSVKNIEAGNEAVGISLGDYADLHALDENETSNIEIDTVKGGSAYGLRETTSKSLTADSLTITNIIADKAEAVGFYSANGSSNLIDNIGINTVNGVTEAYGIQLNDGVFADNTVIGIEGVTTSGENSKVYGLYFDSSSEDLKTASVTVENIGNTNAGESYGIYNKGRAWIGNGLSISNVSAAEDATAIGFYNHSYTTVAETSQNTLSISNVSGGEVHGLKNYGRSEESNAELETSQISIDSVTGTTSAYGIHNTGYSTFASEADASTLVANPAEDPSLADSAWVYVHDVKATDGEAYGIYTDSEMKNAYTSNLNIVDVVRGTTEAIGFNADNDVKASLISVNDVEASAGNAYGIYFNEATLRSSDENLINLAATNVNATGGDAKGFYFKGWQKSLGDTQSITAQNIHSSTGSAIGVHLDNSGLSVGTKKTTVSETVVSGVEGKTFI